MNEIVEELRKWREARNMQNNGFVVEEQVAYMLDECKEVLLAKTDEHRAEEHCDVAILAFNGLGLSNSRCDDVYSASDDISKIIRFLSWLLNTRERWQQNHILSLIVSMCNSAVNELGYDFQKMMLEKIKVISSREQDPEQAKEWALNGASGKWLKSSSQSKDTLYKPDFESCRIGK